MSTVIRDSRIVENGFRGEGVVGIGDLKLGRLQQQQQKKQTQNLHNQNGFLDLLCDYPFDSSKHSASPLSFSPESTSKSSGVSDSSFPTVIDGLNVLGAFNKKGVKVRKPPRLQQQQQTLHNTQNGFLNHHSSDSTFDSASNGRPSPSFSTVPNGFHHDNQNVPNGFDSGLQQLIWDQSSLLESPSMTSGFTALVPSSSVNNGVSPSPEAVSPEDTEIFSDMMLTYINRILMEEDMDGKFDVYPEHPALLAAEKPFYEILGEKFPPSPDRPPLCCCQCEESPDESMVNQFGSCHGIGSAAAVLDDSYSNDPREHHQPQRNPVSVGYSPQSSFSSTDTAQSAMDRLEESLQESLVVSDLLNQSQPAWQFERGLEEGGKFVPSSGKLVIDLESNGFDIPQEAKEEKKMAEIKAENEEKEYLPHESRGKKNPHDDDLDQQEGRSNKQSATFAEETLRTEMFDNILLCNEEKCAAGIDKLRATLQKEAIKCSHVSQSKGSGGRKGRGKRQTKEVVDLRTLLIHCAQSVATDDRRAANELLKQIRKHASIHGDANQRLAHYFADGLEARLDGTGSQIYHSLVANRISVTDVLKAYGLYVAACPFKKISHFFSNQTIMNAAEKATRLHIIDYGVYYGFQWPCFMQRLANRPGGPPQLRITGIDNPMSGFRPSELIDETGRRLADYARSFGIPFKFHAIAADWESITAEDLNIDKDEVLIVNCLFRFKSLADETVLTDSPRDMVLNTIRKLNPTVFIHGVLNGSYNAPFFVTRFREALFHFSALFDMIETNVPREDASRQLIEKALYGRESMNVISCEGLERVERPETYKQWQVRNLRAGFKQLPLNPGIVKKAKDKCKACYHKDFVVDVDSRWLLQGWKGRIIFALSTWKPSSSFYLH